MPWVCLKFNLNKKNQANWKIITNYGVEMKQQGLVKEFVRPELKIVGIIEALTTKNVFNEQVLEEIKDLKVTNEEDEEKEDKAIWRTPHFFDDGNRLIISIPVPKDDKPPHDKNFCKSLRNLCEFFWKVQRYLIEKEVLLSYGYISYGY